MLRLFSFPKECPARGFSGNPVPQRIQCSFGDSVLLDRRINLDVLNELGSRAFGDGAILKKLKKSLKFVKAARKSTGICYN
jgi:hypothetical protein